MSVLIYGFGLFGVAVLFHTALWRIKKPANTIKALVAIFCLVLAVGMMIIRQHEFINYIYIAVLFFSLFSVYLLTYPAIEADSPSLVITLQIARAKNSGITAAQIKELLKDNLLVEPRLKDLVDAKMVELNGSVYKINRKGVLFIQPFIAYRKFLKLGKGG